VPIYVNVWIVVLVICVNHKDGCQLRDGKVPLIVWRTCHGYNGQNASWLGAAL
jgi:hypothetical protein